MVRNAIELRDRWARLQGSPVELDLSRYDGPVEAIESRAGELRGVSDSSLRAEARALRHRALRGEPRTDLVEPTFALVSVVSERVLGLRPYAEQIVAGLAMTEQKVVEMQTGEGKTLAAVMPVAVCNALDRPRRRTS